MVNKIINKKFNLIAIICVMLSSAALGFCFFLMPPPTLKDQSQAATGVYVDFYDELNGNAETYQQDTGTYLLLETPSSTRNTFNGWQRDGEPEGTYSGFVSDGTLRESQGYTMEQYYQLSSDFIEATTNSGILIVNMWVCFNSPTDAELLGIYNIDDSGENAEPIFVLGTSNATGLTCVVNNDLDNASLAGAWDPYEFHNNEGWHMLTVVYFSLNIGGGRFAGIVFFVDGEQISVVGVAHSTINFGQNVRIFFGGLDRSYEGFIQNWGLFCSLDIMEDIRIIKAIYDESVNNYNGQEATLFMFGEKDMSFNAVWEVPSVTLTIDANGGSYGGVTSIKQFPETTTTLSVPTREGYLFRGWAQANISAGASVGNVGRLDTTHTDPFLMSGNIFSVYNNGTAGNVVHERVEKPPAVPSAYNTHVLKIGNKGAASPGLGGYVRQVQSYANAEFYTIIQAKIPIGYKIEWQANQTGTGRDYKWLTPTQGTGDWGVYIFYMKCGSSGIFSTTNYFNITSITGAPVYGTTTYPKYWYVASSAAYDATGMGLNPDTYVSNISTSTTYKFGNANQTLVAIWEPDTWDLYATTPTLNADGYYHVSTPNQLAYFAKLAETQNVTAKIKLVNDIDLSAHRWKPIGNDKYNFQCTAIADGTAVFDGQGYKITGLKHSETRLERIALFGTTASKVEIKNVSIHGEIKLSIVQGKVYEHYIYIAGLLAYGSAKITNCQNYVNITDVASGLPANNVGGIAGGLHGSGIKDCANYGTISTGRKVGGIVGWGIGGVSIKNCINVGNISASSSVGGIAGDSSGGIENCTNQGNISAGSYVGGIAGKYEFEYDYSDSSANKVTKCYNFGTITGGSYLGGIFGSLEKDFGYDYESSGLELSYCYNGGDIVGTGDQVGGLIGSLKLMSMMDLPYEIIITIKNCGVNANVTGRKAVGGFIGQISYEYMGYSSEPGMGMIIYVSIVCDIENSYFNGTISGNQISADAEYVGVIEEGYSYDAIVELYSSISRSNTYANATLKSGTTTTLRKTYSSGLFEDFSYVNGINDGLPVPKWLCWIGGVGGQDVVTYLKGKGFTLVA